MRTLTEYWRVAYQLNLHTNSFCPLDTALALTSNNLLLNFTLSIPLTTPWWHLSKTLVTPSLLCAHIHSLSSDWEGWPCPLKYFNFVSVCVFVCLSTVNSSLMLCYLYFSTFLSTWSVHYYYYTSFIFHSLVFSKY